MPGVVMRLDGNDAFQQSLQPLRQPQVLQHYARVMGKTALMEEKDIPWDEISFPSVRYTLERFLEDRRNGSFGFHITTWDRPIQG